MIKKQKRLQAKLYRREGKERRGWSPMPESPFEDSDGETVTYDRRRIIDRRKEGQIKRARARRKLHRVR